MKDNLNITIKKSTPSSRSTAAKGVAQWMRNNSNAGHSYFCVPHENGFAVGHPYRDKFVVEALGSSPVDAFCKALVHLVPSLDTIIPKDMPDLIQKVYRAGYQLELNDQCSVNGTGSIYLFAAVALRKKQKQMYG
jgi:hypothetical protein